MSHPDRGHTDALRRMTIGRNPRRGEAPARRSASRRTSRCSLAASASIGPTPTRILRARGVAGSTRARTRTAGIDVEELHQWHTSRRLLGAAICLRCVRDEDIEAVHLNLAGLLTLSTCYSTDPVHTAVTDAAFATVAGGRRSSV